MNKIENYLGVANHDIQMANSSQELKSYVASILYENDKLQQENQELKKHLEVPKQCNLKTIEDYKSYYEDTTKEEILKDTYIDYCAYVNLAHEYAELKKQLEQINKFKFNYRNDKTNIPTPIYNKNAIKDNCKYKNEQKEFIEYLEDEIYSIEPKGTGIIYNCEYDSEENYINAMKEQSRLNTLKNVLSKYREIIGVSNENNKQ